MFITPALLVYLVILVVPTLGSIWIGFHEWRGIGDEPIWVGLRNYFQLTQSPAFQTSFTNTMLILVVGGVLVFGVALVFTAVLRDGRNKNFVRAVIFVPVVVPPVALAIAWGVLLAPNGLANGVITSLGGQGVVWLSPDNLFRSVIVAVVWIYAGFIATILLAGVDRIPRDLYEAAEIDGASNFDQFRYVTVPLIWDVVGVAVVLWAIAAIKIFEFVFALGGAGSDPSVNSWTLGIQTYMEAFGTRVPVLALGRGSAIGTVMLILVGITVLIARKVFRRDTVYF